MNRLRNFYFLIAFVFLGVVSAQGQAKLLEKVEAKPGEAKIAYSKYELPNGLTVYIHEDHSDPMVHVEVTYKVGSNREHIGITGFAHFFEHMMFQGSKHVGDEEHIKIIESAGGQMNGTTSEDRTNYFETLPSNMLETALWLEADRMGWLLPAVTQEKFEIQRSAVKNEKEQNIVNQPYALPIVEFMRRDMYPKGHPYSWPVIGYVDDLDRVGVDDLRNFFLRWYGPNNAVLVIAGDVDPSETIKLVEKYFGTIPRGQEVKSLRVEPLVLQQNIFAQYADNVFVPLVSMTFPTVPNYHRDEAALDILADVLGGGRNSIFYQRMVKNKFALQASVSHPCRELAGEFQFQIAPNPRNVYDLSPLTLQTMVYDSIKAIMNDFDVMRDVKDEDLNRIKATFESSFITTLESIQGKASTITSWDRMLPGKTHNLQDDIDRYQNVTKQDLLRVYNKYIKNRGAFVSVIFAAGNQDMRTKSLNPYPGEVDEQAEKQYEGLKYEEPVSDFDRSIQPTPPPAKPSTIPSYSKGKMANGIQYIHTTNPEIPKVTMIFNIAGGQLLEATNPKLLGLATITAGMMNEGTAKRGSEEIDAALDLLGSSIYFSAGATSTSIVVSSLTRNLDATLLILEEMLYEPGFKSEDFDRLIDQMKENLNNADKNPGVLARKAFDLVNYGESILAANSNGYSNTISKITLNDVKAFYSNYYSPSVTNLTIVGDIGMDEILPKLGFLEKWQAKPVTIPAIAPFPKQEKTTIYFVSKPGATQSQIIYGTRTLPYEFGGDFYKLNVANYSLGGSFNARINIRLREEKGFTYGAHGYQSGGKYSGTWQVSTSVRGDATDSALVELHQIVKNYVSNGMTVDELKTTKNSLNQSDALKYETSYEKAGFLSRILSYDLPDNYTQQQTNTLNNIGVDELNGVVRKYINPEEMVIIVVADPSVKDKLKKTGIGPIKAIDPNKVKIKAVK